jgi:pyruvate kinase
MVDMAERLLEEGGHVKPREIVGIVAGTRTKSGSTNFLRLHVLGDREGTRKSAKTAGVVSKRQTKAAKTGTAKGSAKPKPRTVRSGA